MINRLEGSIRHHLYNENILKRYVRPEEAAEKLNISVKDVLDIALAAGARYQLPRITLIHLRRLEDFMKHLYKVPGTNKIVHKKYVRIGEGSITYSVGHHRFIEMARAAGAVYKIGDSQGGTVLINLELFDDYMEQFHEPVREMRNSLFEGKKEGC